MEPIKLIYNFRLISKDNEKIMNRQGRYFLSSKFKKFERKVRLSTVAQYRLPPLVDDLKVSIIAGFTNKRHSDCSYLSKGVLDALQGIVYNNDRQVKRFECFVLEDEPRDSFIIVVERVNDRNDQG